MTKEQAEKVLEKLNSVRPEQLKGEAKSLFEAIMKIANERDLYKSMLEEKDKIIDLMAEEFVSKTLMYSDMAKQEAREYFENKAKEYLKER